MINYKYFFILFLALFPTYTLCSINDDYKIIFEDALKKRNSAIYKLDNLDHTDEYNKLRTKIDSFWKSSDVQSKFESHYEEVKLILNDVHINERRGKVTVEVLKCIFI